MHIGILLVSLAASGSAIPLAHNAKGMFPSNPTVHLPTNTPKAEGEVTDMAHDDVAKPKVETYADYGTYYTNYGKYSSKEDAMTNANMAKRSKLATYTPYSTYGCYPGAPAEEEEGKIAGMKKRNYACYDSYGTYAEAVDKAGSKTDKNTAKRHEMKMHKEMIMTEHRGHDAIMQTRNVPPTTETGERKAPHETLPGGGDSKYQSYEYSLPPPLLLSTTLTERFTN